LRLRFIVGDFRDVVFNVSIADSSVSDRSDNSEPIKLVVRIFSGQEFAGIGYLIQPPVFVYTHKEARNQVTPDRATFTDRQLTLRLRFFHLFGLAIEVVQAINGNPSLSKVVTR